MKGVRDDPLLNSGKSLHQENVSESPPCQGGLWTCPSWPSYNNQTTLPLNTVMARKYLPLQNSLDCQELLPPHWEVDINHDHLSQKVSTRVYILLQQCGPHSLSQVGFSRSRCLGKSCLLALNTYKRKRGRYSMGQRKKPNCNAGGDQVLPVGVSVSGQNCLISLYMTTSHSHQIQPASGRWLSAVATAEGADRLKQVLP